jgi:hypothetical protein
VSIRWSQFITELVTEAAAVSLSRWKNGAGDGDRTVTSSLGTWMFRYPAEAKGAIFQHPCI